MLCPDTWMPMITLDNWAMNDGKYGEIPWRCLGDSCIRGIGPRRTLWQVEEVLLPGHRNVGDHRWTMAVMGDEEYY